MQYAIISNRIRLVTEYTNGTAVVITGNRERFCSATRSPGSGWKTVVGVKNRWVKREPITEAMAIEADRVVHSEEWPVGVTEFNFDVSHYLPIVKASVAVAMSINPRASKRDPPVIELASVQQAMKDAGLAIPTKEEFDLVIYAAWDVFGKPKGRNSIDTKAIKAPKA